MQELSTVLASTALVSTAQGVFDSQLWWGPSGHQVTGAEVAIHLSAAAHHVTADPEAGLYKALQAAQSGGSGDDDSRRVAERLMEALLRLHTGARDVDYEAWSKHRTTTVVDQVAFLEAAASAALSYGPTGAR
jgi:hypothetical protein